MEPIKSIINVDDSSGRLEINTLESDDRISDLPDAVVAFILSFIPTKNAVATSTLSKRWEFVWRAVRDLDFCLDLRGNDLTEHVGDENNKFIRFVNHVLSHYDAGVLNKFCLVWTHDCSVSHATSWIKTAITRKVHVISLTLSDYHRDEPFDMPISVFSCDSLRSLDVDGWISLSAGTMFSLPRLESLHLNGVAFQSDEAFEQIIRGCVVLNHLHINMDEEDDTRCIISSTSLKRLELNFRKIKYVKLEAPSLEHLKIHGYKSVNLVQKNLSSLVDANFGVQLYYGDYSQAGMCKSVVDSVRALDTAKILTLSFKIMRALSCATVKLATNFKRLVKLETSTLCCYWSSLQDIIQTSNNLEVLVIHQCLLSLDVGKNHHHSNWITPVEVPGCLPTSLKKVVLSGYNGHEDELEMIRYMLQHGSVLEVMEISCHGDDNRKKFELLQEICEFPRKSPACEVKFLG